MDFSKRKLPMEASARLRICPVDTVKPFALMIAPVYVLLRRNQKFVSVKAPLDFFTPEELERLRSFESFFVPEFVDNAVPYRQLARRVKMMLGWNPVESATVLPPAPFELADGVLRLMAPLWGGGRGIETFFVAVFSNEFCALLPGEELRAARDRDQLGFERAVLFSAWMVFLLLHIGVADREYLDGVRLRSFRRCMDAADVPRMEDHSEAGELYHVLEELLAGESLQGALSLVDFESRKERVARKIAARIRRVNLELKPVQSLFASIHGKGGFVDV